MMLSILETHKFKRMEILSPATHYVASRYGFSQRESEVYDLIITKGIKNCEIAALLNISEKTVKNHISNMMMKSQANSTREMMSFGFQAVGV